MVIDTIEPALLLLLFADKLPCLVFFLFYSHQAWKPRGTAQLFFSPLDFFKPDLKGISSFWGFYHLWKPTVKAVGLWVALFSSALFTWPVDNDWRGQPSLRCTLSNRRDKWGVEGPTPDLLAPDWRWCFWAGSVAEAAGWASALGGDWHYLWPCWPRCRIEWPVPVCLPAWAPHTMSITSITNMVPYPSPSTGCPSSQEEATVSPHTFHFIDRVAQTQWV